jgi:hypothetical protein
MLIGLAITVFVTGVWPWILAVLGLASAPFALERAGLPGLIAPAWLVALAILFEADMIWPGILVLVILTVLARGVISARSRR